ncbi:uncharacterized protein LOC110906644 [Helianthus annuus]|uniref:uncharacterized protein LOC110906644 n=1 Tax=Helianthus annuus TaxID=4232 RepID=UPI000B8F4135|nr:uncharacterized protein LOC110906644 [Helianthus annuus]
MERGVQNNLNERIKPGEHMFFDRGKPPTKVQGLASRVVDIDGKTMLPRRGVVLSAARDPGKFNIIDELSKITVLVDENVNVPVQPPEFETVGLSYEARDKCVQQPCEGSTSKPMSYADTVVANGLKKVNFRSLASSAIQDGCDVVLPRESVRSVQDKLANTLYGYFLGDRIAFPVVDYYVRTHWKKYGLSKTMMKANGFFFFKFNDEVGLSNALKDGPWIIRSQPLFLDVWTPTTKLEKKEVKKVQVWVKIHEVPLAAYTEDGLSLIAITIGEPKMLDSFTTSMCIDAWGRSSYARALIEISAENELREEITMAIPEPDGEGFIKETLYVEYEWSPHRCASCCVFGHSTDMCPKHPKKQPMVVYENHNRNGQKNYPVKKAPIVDQDGYTGVYGKKAARKVGIPVNKQKSKFEYRPVGSKPKGDVNKESVRIDKRSNNPFDVLNDVEDESGSSNKKTDLNNEESDEDEVIEVETEMDGFMTEGTRNTNSKGASTPSPIVTNVFRSWEWTSNGNCCSKGIRIIIGWNLAIFDVMILAQSNQVMHLQLVFKLDKRMTFCSIVYAENYYMARRDVWNNLSIHKALVADKPWCIMGDFNTALNIEDNSMGSSSISTGLLKKLDRVMGNTNFIADFPNSVAIFKPYRLSDHYPCILSFPNATRMKPRSFKFANFLVFKPEFLEIVNSNWITNVNGIHQFRVVKKLRLLKHPLRSLLFKQGNIHKKVENLRSELDLVQQKIDQDNANADLRAAETVFSRDLQEALLDEERFLKQKSKVDWLRAGDMNSAFFHSSMKMKNHCSRIEVIKDSDGNLYEGDTVFHPFVKHYERFFGTQGDTSLIPAPDLFSKRLSPQVAHHMIRQVSAEEVKRAMFGIGIDKAPGPDGYTAAFFKSAWPIVGNDVTCAIIDFFETGKLLRELNHTNIVLIPKIPTPSTVSDYRPIACCNVLYKCISKIIADRIKGALNDIVSINQSAFVPGRRISDNILLTQELMHNYHRNVGPPRCAFKVDIQKAYDTVNWRFLKSVLLGFGFTDKMIAWIMVCVSTASFSMCVNGSVHGFFQGKRGLRQGDPISPYLFTLVMEVLTAILHHAVRIDSSFKFHNKCEKQQIINLCFADDLFLFARGEVNSARLDYSDCRVLVDRLQKRITHWRNKLLSFAGRLQLITSVLSAMHIYWSSVFMLPSRIVLELEACMRNFLWSQDSSYSKGKSKVSWKTVCTPKYEGGLGIRRIGDMNKALMSYHIWSIVSKRDSLWVDWVHSYRLKGKSFWICKSPANCCWSWRKIVQLRPLIRNHLWSDLGNGANTSAWFDYWSDIGPLGDFISPRSITDADLKLDDSVANIYSNGSWAWPLAWRDLFPVLIQLDQVQLTPMK